MYANLKKHTLNGVCIGHANPAALLVKGGVVAAEHVDSLMAEYSASAIAEKWRRVCAGVPTSGPGIAIYRGKADQPESPDDALRRRVASKLKARQTATDDKFRRETWQKLKARLASKPASQPEPKRSGDEYETAIHEAGHAFVAVYYGGTVRHAEVGEQPYGGYGGFVMRGHVDCQMPVDHAIHVNIAGPIAQAHWRGKEWTPGLEHGEFGDIVNILSSGHPADEDSLRPYTREVTALLKRHWRTVATIADKLLSAGTLTGDEIENIMRAQGSKALA